MTEFLNRDSVETGDEMQVRPESGRLYGFVICHPQNFFQYLNLIQTKELKQRDFAVLFGLITFMNSKTGRCHLSLTHLADLFAVNKTTIYSSVARLKKNFMVANYVDKVTGEKSLMINPFLVSLGGKSRRAIAFKTFEKLFDS